MFDFSQEERWWLFDVSGQTILLLLWPFVTQGLVYLLRKAQRRSRLSSWGELMKTFNYLPTVIHWCKKFNFNSREDWIKYEFMGRLHPPSLCALKGRDVCGFTVCLERNVSRCVVHVRIQKSSHPLQQINLYLNYWSGLISWLLLGSRKQILNMILSLPNLEKFLYWSWESWIKDLDFIIIQVSET